MIVGTSIFTGNEVYWGAERRWTAFVLRAKPFQRVPKRTLVVATSEGDDYVIDVHIKEVEW